MNLRLFYPTALLALMLPAIAGVARADRNPDFDDDATPILQAQPQLVEYVHHHFDVKDTGQARVPGDGDHPPQPPFIFQARPLHSAGPYFLRLLVQPGAPGHILKVVDMRTVHLSSPDQPPAASVGAAAPMTSVAPVPPPQLSQPSVQPAASPEAPTADTPSGPIPDSTSTSLAPPADQAPVTR